MPSVNANFPESQSELKPLVIESIHVETKNFKTFIFRQNYDMPYQAGQFLTLVDHSGIQEIRRSYSLVSSPVLTEPMAIGVKRMDNGFFSRMLVDRAKPGDTLWTLGPSGFFKLPENLHSFKLIFFFAAGSGITPILSLLKTTLYAFPDIQVILFYSNASVEQTAFYEYLKELEKQFTGRLKIHFLFSSTADLRKARLNRDFLLERITLSDLEKKQTLFYVCGPESYMRLIIFHLLEEGFPKDHIKKEDFNPGNRKPSLHLPPDKNNYDIRLKLRGKEYILPVHYPDTILQAARKVKFNIPYSCETGKCGTCAAYCQSGKIWMAKNEVLTQQELAKGLVLTCTGHPQSPDLLLVLD